MPPVDSTPNLKTGNFELVYSLKAYDRIPVSEYKSNATGLTVVIAQVDGPVVNGFFCVVTEAYDDDGLPHTLEHLIFLGSEQYPYKGILDMLANRCLASGTNAWTDIDHTCYTMETAGSEGFLILMPIYLEHILYPCLTDEAFVTEVHHVTAEGEDSGVVYCEIQGRENSAESLVHLNMARQIYPGRCGYSSETGGLMKNLRESTTNEKIRNYHQEFYRPENLKVIITGQIKPEDVFKALAGLEQKILSKGERKPFQRPWQSEVPPLLESKELVIKYPSDDESNGIFSMAWRGPSAVKELYLLSAASILLKYLTETAVSPLQKEFVEIADPYASKVVYNLYENSESCLYLLFQDVPTEKLGQIKSKLLKLFEKMVNEEDFDMERMKGILNRYKLESLSNIENNPHHTVAFLIIGHMLYGNTKNDLHQRINPLTDLEKMAKEPKSFWISLLRKYFVDNKSIAIQGTPSIEEQKRLNSEERERILKQREKLGERGLDQMGKLLESAVAFNERLPKEDILAEIPIPTVESINFHNIQRFNSEVKTPQLDLTDTPVFTYFDHVRTGFAYLFALMDTSNLAPELRLYLPVMLETLFESPVERDGKLIPYEEVVSLLHNDTVTASGHVGLSSSRRSFFKCGSYSETVTCMLQVEASKYEKGIEWLSDILYGTKFTVERLKIIAQKIINAVSQAKRNARDVILYVMRGLCYMEDTNIQSVGILKQHKFLINMVEKLESGNAKEVLNDIEKIRDELLDPNNFVLYIAGNLDNIKSPVQPIRKYFTGKSNSVPIQKRLHVVPDWQLTKPNSEGLLQGTIISMGCLESSFFYQTTPSIISFLDPDLPALLLYIQYLIQAEGPMWKQIRGKGHAYNYTIMQRTNEGRLYLVFGRSTNVVGAYKEAKEIITKQLNSTGWDERQLEAARSSLIFEIIDEEKTIGDVVSLSLSSYFQGVEYKFNRALISRVKNVTVQHLNIVGKKYLSHLFEPSMVRTAVITDPLKAEEIRAGLEQFDLKVNMYPSLEESFLNWC